MLAMQGILRLHAEYAFDFEDSNIVECLRIVLTILEASKYDDTEDIKNVIEAIG